MAGRTAAEAKAALLARRAAKKAADRAFKIVLADLHAREAQGLSSGISNKALARIRAGKTTLDAEVRSAGKRLAQKAAIEKRDRALATEAARAAADKRDQLRARASLRRIHSFILSEVRGKEREVKRGVYKGKSYQIAKFLRSERPR